MKLSLCWNTRSYVNNVCILSLIYGYIFVSVQLLVNVHMRVNMNAGESLRKFEIKTRVYAWICARNSLNMSVGNKQVQYVCNFLVSSLWRWGKRVDIPLQKSVQGLPCSFSAIDCTRSPLCHLKWPITKSSIMRTWVKLAMQLANYLWFQKHCGFYQTIFTAKSLWWKLILTQDHWKASGSHFLKHWSKDQMKVRIASFNRNNRSKSQCKAAPGTKIEGFNILISMN